MDIERVLQRLRTPADLPVESKEDMASEVHVLAEKKPRPKGSISYLKAPVPVTVNSPLTTSPADILRELGVATTFVHQSRFLPVAQLWAHVRYCATMRATSRGLLALSPDAAKSVVHHHKVTQSEQLGIGLALVVARAVLRKLHPTLDYHVVDADVALKAGYIRGMPGEVRNRPATKKRPDYFLVGFDRRTPGAAVHVTVLECKGTHLTMREVRKQLADACLQVRTVVVGTEPLYGLMVASRLEATGIRSYVFDPPGDDQLWSGDREDLQDLLSHRPEEKHWSPGRWIAPPPPPSSGSSPADPTTGGADAQVLGTPPPYQIPAQERRWFTQVLSSTTAATMLAWAGDNATASGYATARQLNWQQEPLDDFESWPVSTSDRIRFAQGGPTLLGHTQRMQMGDGGPWRCSADWKAICIGNWPTGTSIDICVTPVGCTGGGRSDGADRPGMLSRSVRTAALW
ncbi:hypothetical protein ACQP2E_28155 [Actinoplanes sp. CA-015351]|uniref:hypothetical protein n=1 Tax=Actinoplanes sp. CA-015351 TaxID=3239897 RepID=UPI003D951FC4